MSVTQTSTTKSLLAKFEQITDTNEDSKPTTEFDLILQLSRKGWDFEMLKPNRKTPSYKAGAEKKWYFHSLTSKGGINKKYLTVLLHSDTLFEKGLREIFHFQLNKYYEALETVPESELNAVRPWQPKSYYDLLIQQHRPSKRNNRSQRRTFDFADADDEPGDIHQLFSRNMSMKHDTLDLDSNILFMCCYQISDGWFV